MEGLNMLYEVVLGFASNVPTMTVYTEAEDSATAVRQVLDSDIPDEKIYNIKIVERPHAKVI